MSRIARVHKSLLSTAGANPSTYALQRSSRGASCQLRKATRFVTVILAIRRCRVHGACAPQAPPPCHMHGRRPRACPKAPEKGYLQHPVHTDLIINYPPGRRTVGAPYCKGRPVSAAPQQKKERKARTFARRTLQSLTGCPSGSPPKTKHLKQRRRCTIWFV